MAPPHPRVVNAFHAMRELGIAEEKVKPILKKLLKLYDKNWDPIEDENYRVLIDAIFESEEPQVLAPISSKKRGNSEAPTASPKKEIVEASSKKKMNDMSEEQTELPLKRHRSTFQDQVSYVDESSTFSAGCSRRIPYDEPIDCPESFHPAVSYSDKPNEKGGERFPQEGNGAGPSDIKKTIDDYPVPLAVIYPDKPNGKGGERFPQEGNGAGPSDIKKTIDDYPVPLAVIYPDKPNGKGGERFPQEENGAGPSDIMITVDDYPEPIPLAVIYSDKPNGKGGERFPQEENGAGPSDIKITVDDYPEPIPLAVIYSDKPNGKGCERFPQEENGAGPSDINITVDDYPESLPLDVIYSDKPNEKGVERFAQEENGAGSSAGCPSDTSSHGFSCHLVASSSPRGEVKMFLNCNASQVSDGFRMPAVEDVFQLVEDRCRERYNIQDPNFSIKNIMEDMSKGVLELGSES